MRKYEELLIEVLPLSEKDVITTSAFNGTDDNIDDWGSNG